MTITFPFLSPGFLGCALVAVLVLSAVLPPRFRWWWVMVGGGMLAAIIAAGVGLVPWLGDLHLTGYSVMLLLAFVLAYVTTMPRAKILGIGERTITDMAMIALLGGIIGSRIGEMIEQWPRFGQDANGQPLTFSALISKALDFDGGGMVWYGGAILAGVLIILYAKKRRLRLLEVCDLLIPGVLLALGTGRVGCFLNGCCFGKATTAPWAVANPLGIASHPTQLYETLACVLLFGLTWWRWRHRRFQGEIVFIGIMGYAIWRFFNEGLRGDTVGSSFLGLWSLTTSQAVSLYLVCGLLALTSVVIVRRIRNPTYAALGRDVPGSSQQRKTIIGTQAKVISSDVPPK
jgi:phosphatidylglycerol---prolipoprotein diacylglyceryl transferase